LAKARNYQPASFGFMAKTKEQWGLESKICYRDRQKTYGDTMKERVIVNEEH
jgi:hypothetical protein